MSKSRSGAFAETCLAQVLDPEWIIAYELRIKERVYIHSRGEYAGLAPRTDMHAGPVRVNHQFRFSQSILPQAVGRAAAETQAYSKLVCDDYYAPLSYTISAGSKRTHIRFHSGRAIVTVATGEVIDTSAEKVSFLLAGNMMPQLAIAVRLLFGADAFPFVGRFYSPEAMQPVDYELYRKDDRIISSLEETIQVDSTGWIEAVHFPDPDIMIARVAAQPRRWKLENRGRSRPRPRKYRKPRGIQSIEVSIPGPVVDIGATFTLPKRGGATKASVLFIAGSGQHDRHGMVESVDLGYHQLLDSIARLGIASLRFDKRGMGGTRTGTDVPNAGFEAVVADAESALQEVSRSLKTAGVPLFLVGHSQGGLVALILASRHPDLDGLVLLATAGRPLDEVLKDQVRHECDTLGLSDLSFEHRIHYLETFFRSVREVENWNDKTVPKRVLANRHLRRWYAELLAYDPRELVRITECPLLIVQGDADSQVGVSDAHLLRDAALGAARPVEMKLLSGLDHLFMDKYKYRRFTTCAFRRRQISRALIGVVSQWILKVAEAK